MSRPRVYIQRVGGGAYERYMDAANEALHESLVAVTNHGRARGSLPQDAVAAARTGASGVLSLNGSGAGDLTE